MPLFVLSSLELEDDAVLLRGPPAPAAEEQEQDETAHEGQARTGGEEGPEARLGRGGGGGPRRRRGNRRGARPPTRAGPAPEVRKASRPLWALAAAGRCCISSGVARP